MEEITGSVLVVDDQDWARTPFCSYLRYHQIHTFEASSYEEALVRAEIPDLFLVFADIVLGDGNGLDLMEEIRAKHPGVEVVLFTGRGDLSLGSEALRRGAFFFLSKPFELETGLLLTRRAWEVRSWRSAYDTLKTAVTGDQVIEIMRSLAEAVDAKSPYTRDHSERVGCLARRLAREIRLPEKEVETTYFGALLHDLGKMGVPDSILNLEDSLDETQRAQIQEHTILGEKILAPILALQPLRPILRSHHENWDGTGYPDGLAGEEIPLPARIVRIADSYDAMTSIRPYLKDPMTDEEALLKMAEKKGTFFDPDLLDAFLGMMFRAL